MVDNGHERLNPEFLIYLCTGLGSLTSIIFSLSQAGVQSRTFKESSNRLSSQGTTWQGKIIGLGEKKVSPSWTLGIVMRKIPLFL